MGKIGRIAKGANREFIASLRRIEDSEGRVKVLYSHILDDFIDIGKKASSQNALALVSDLEQFIKDLEGLKKITRNNKKFTNDIDVLIEKTTSFVEEYKRASKGGSFGNPRERINTYIAFLQNNLKPILGGLKDEAKKLNQIEKLIRSVV